MHHRLPTLALMRALLTLTAVSHVISKGIPTKRVYPYPVSIHQMTQARLKYLTIGQAMWKYLYFTELYMPRRAGMCVLIVPFY